MSGCFLAAGKGAPKLGKKEIGTLSAPTAKHEGALVWDVGSWVSKNTESLDWMKPSDPWGQPRWGYEQKAVEVPPPPPTVDSPGVWIGRVKMPKGTESWLLSLAVAHIASVDGAPCSTAMGGGSLGRRRGIQTERGVWNL